MDIFEESLSPLGVSVVFDENNLFSCEINQESTEGRGRAPWQLTVYRDQDDISLAISIVLGTPLPDNPTPDFITLLGEQAIEPLRGGVGIGIYPGTSQLAVYQRVQLSGKPTGIVMEAIKSLFAIAEEWESLLSPERQKTPIEHTPPESARAFLQAQAVIAPPDIGNHPSFIYLSNIFTAKSVPLSVSSNCGKGCLCAMLSGPASRTSVERRCCPTPIPSHSRV
ncbi:hypothetical protein [Edwardsiella ictaluri]|uniref:hypothetical protein n=1 Tax=Edwardsiella ictaluri TaxID=67780 RepID=UPI0024175A69|nr:hypothetical protein [Edwardsiella ictaluri]WFO13042.1 type III secretion system chaperone [Edwardsiella ictaluri]